MVNSNDSRHNARKAALCALFEWSFRPCSLDDSLKNAANFIDGKNFDSNMAKKLVEGVKQNLTKIDNIITANATEWPLSQIAKIDLSILRLGVLELLFYKKETPLKVAVDEAVELAKEFGSETSSSFVNGVLGNILENGEKNS